MPESPRAFRIRRSMHDGVELEPSAAGEYTAGGVTYTAVKTSTPRKWEDVVRARARRDDGEAADAAASPHVARALDIALSSARKRVEQGVGAVRMGASLGGQGGGVVPRSAPPTTVVGRMGQPTTPPRAVHQARLVSRSPSPPPEAAAAPPAYSPQQMPVHAPVPSRHSLGGSPVFRHSRSPNVHQQQQQQQRMVVVQQQQQQQQQQQSPRMQGDVMQRLHAAEALLAAKDAELQQVYAAMRERDTRLAQTESANSDTSTRAHLSVLDLVATIHDLEGKLEKAERRVGELEGEVDLRDAKIRGRDLILRDYQVQLAQLQATATHPRDEQMPAAAEQMPAAAEPAAASSPDASAERPPRSPASTSSSGRKRRVRRKAR